MLYACVPIRSVCPVTVMTSKLAPLRSAANLSRACLPAGFRVALSKSKRESAEKVTFVGTGGRGGGGGVTAGGGGGGGGVTTTGLGAGAAATRSGARVFSPNRYTRPTEKRKEAPPFLPAAAHFGLLLPASRRSPRA